MVSPVCVTRFNKVELCKLESQAASNRKNDLEVRISNGNQRIYHEFMLICDRYLSSPGTSSASPGKIPSERTHESSSISSAGSGVFRIRPALAMKREHDI